MFYVALHKNKGWIVTRLKPEKHKDIFLFAYGGYRTKKDAERWLKEVKIAMSK